MWLPEEDRFFETQGHMINTIKHLLGGRVAEELKLDDMLDGDLVLTDGDKVRTDIGYLLVTYQWRVGFGYERAYVRRLEEEK